MSIKEWLAEISHNAGYGTIAGRSGLNAGTFKRQYEKEKIPADTLVKIARAYNVSPIKAFIAADLITEDEAGIQFLTLEMLKTATDRQLLEELLRRIQNGGQLHHPELFEPLDENSKAVKNVEEINKSDLAVPDPPDEYALAAFKTPYDPSRENIDQMPNYEDEDQTQGWDEDEYPDNDWDEDDDYQAENDQDNEQDENDQ